MIARLPCFATGIPAAATTSAAVVEMLNVPEPSPPVPTTSIAPSGASTCVTRSRIALAKPASSSTVSPRIRRPMSSAASCDGVASPSITSPIASRASSIVSVRPSTIAASASRTRWLIGRPRGAPRRARRRRRSRRVGGLGRHRHPARRERARRRVEPRGLALPGEPEEVREQVRAVGREDALRVELDALDRERAVAEPHDDAVLGARRGDVQVGGQRRRVDHQRVVARGRERLRHALEQAGAVVDDLGRLAVDERRGADDRGAVRRRPSTASRGTRRGAGSAGRRRSGPCPPTRRPCPGRRARAR